MIFSRHMQEASHYYENFGLEWSFEYSKNIMVSSKLCVGGDLLGHHFMEKENRKIHK
jgi:hypothetical protein